MVFSRTPIGLKYTGDIAFGSFRALAADRSGRARFATYWHMSATEGELKLWLLKPDGFTAIKSITIHPGGGGTEQGNRIYDELFGPTPVADSMVQGTFGTITAK